ncbi:hypothetical protein GSI_14119 [Ganoderma sinense ZZ0214-1]|uniref:Uncharacterized protein n=1 Tax=Ganoderma sinense ZZ0214-1 TaxID=1077348 RepID=A0A2G8RS78_9APHY|nr:hypothetical protein GSI_14119 [Ganoderma sinense ZZ0214-1]
MCIVIGPLSPIHRPNIVRRCPFPHSGRHTVHSRNLYTSSVLSIAAKHRKTFPHFPLRPAYNQHPLRFLHFFAGHTSPVRHPHILSHLRLPFPSFQPLHVRPT